MRKNRTKTQLLVAIAILGTVLYGHWHSAAQTPQTTESQKTVLGDWQGTLAIGENRLRLVLKVTDAGLGQLKATMDSLDQNSNNLQVDTITFKDGLLHFEMKALSIVYDGALSKDGAEFVGTFKQGAGSFPLVFRKAGIAKSQAAVQRGRVALKPCDDPTLTSEVLCGTYEVFEDRAARSGRKIALNIVLLPATSAKPSPDPLFYLAGGPGGAATTYAREKFMAGLRRNRDVVLVDQRGTGRSNPLNCPPVGSKQDMRGYFGEVLAPERIRACRVELEKSADLKLYTSSIAMDDLDEVRAALGFDRIDLYGGSYGSTAALVYLRQHPQHVRAVAIFGVAPPSAKLPLSFAKGVQDSMNRLFADCAANVDCRTAYPNSEEEFKKILARFDAGPVEADVPNVYTSQTQKVLVTRDAFVDAIRQLLYVPEAASALPLLIHLGAEGNLGPLIGTAFQVVSQIDSKIARGMQFSVICSEDTPFITEDDLKKANSNSFYGDARTRPTIRACAEWTSAKVPVSFLDPVKSDVPVLLISGELDPVTPPWLAQSGASALSRSKVVAIKNGTHASYECVENLVADFIDKGTTEGLDYSCIDKIARPPFNLGR
jgi:pimeloyl-ACP methyl ester carboxylesterase